MKKSFSFIALSFAALSCFAQTPNYNIVNNGIHYRDKELVSQEFKKLVITSSDKAASIIIKAIQRKSKRVMVGPDAKLVRFFSQVAPNLVDGFIIRKKAELEKSRTVAN